jgi:hypothetical protein
MFFMPIGYCPIFTQIAKMLLSIKKSSVVTKHETYIDNRSTYMMTRKKAGGIMLRQFEVCTCLDQPVYGDWLLQFLILSQLFC